MTQTPQPPEGGKPPPGYYPDQSGNSRYWDGNGWTDQMQAPTASQQSAAPHAGTTMTGNPRADAKAAKAYAKASRPWFKKKRWILAIALLLIIVIVAATSGGGSSDDDSASNTSDAPSASTEKKTDEGSNSGEESKDEPSAFGSSKFPLQNGDWRLDSIKIKDDGLGSLGGTARITYTGDNEDGGTNIFTVTLFKGKDAVGSLQGSANTVKPGTAVTVQFISTDEFVKGPYKYDFQNDL
ncbi:DUF2510 domain-containing protein [Aeromicrobium sp.]|uniref:DUF2510 domain-containing protein n=1 Tax=Aeromicrobium sp. TaxID=1871063 RepID=UPI0030C2B149